MAGAITWTRTGTIFECGTDYHDVRVFNFVSPAGGKISVYSCNINVDLDGDPQAYAPLSKPELNPKDRLGDGGFKYAADNELIKKAYEAGKIALADLEKERADLVETKAKAKAAAEAAEAAKAATTSGTPPTPTPAPTPTPTPTPAPASAKAPATPKPKPDPEIDALDKKINDKRAALRKMSFEHMDWKGDYDPRTPNPKNFEKIFWKWYGVHAMTPTEAKNAHPRMEVILDSVFMRMPVLDTTPAYEDVFGRFPVVQSVFEPGPEYFVSPIRFGVNPRYPDWDQRHYLPDDVLDQTPFGALADGLKKDAGLDQGDTVFAIRLDKPHTLSFPFRDMGYGNKVAECSLAAFTGLGGEYHPENRGAAKFPNNFQLIYLTFPNKKTPKSTLEEFARASNADEFPVMLAFIAQASADATINRDGSRNVTADPIRNFENWKKARVRTKPSMQDRIVEGLAQVGITFSNNLRKRLESALGPVTLVRPVAGP